jgi:hypothetical protein
MVQANPRHQRTFAANWRRPPEQWQSQQVVLHALADHNREPKMRLIMAVVLLAALSLAAKADPKPVRVIEITKDNAARSAAAIAAAKSPYIGMQPPGRTVRANSEWRNARAELAENHSHLARADVSRPDDVIGESVAVDASDRARVQIITPGKTGPVAKTYLVPRE